MSRIQECVAKNNALLKDENKNKLSLHLLLKIMFYYTEMAVNKM
jgi:hypothetical protein